MHHKRQLKPKPNTTRQERNQRRPLEGTAIQIIETPSNREKNRFSESFYLNWLHWVLMRLAGKSLIPFFVLLLVLPNLSLVNLANAQISTLAAPLSSTTDAKLVWNRTYTDNNLQSVASAFQTEDGGFLLAGITASNGIPQAWS